MTGAKTLARAGLCWLLLLVPGAGIRADRGQPAAAPVPLEQQLLEEAPAVLAREARREGDPLRGAIVFFQSHLACAKCHVATGQEPPLGPDLARPTEKVTDAYLVESVLNPSKTIKKGFETIAITTKQGKVLTGLQAGERGGEVVLRDPAQDFKVISIAGGDIEERTTAATSIMPTGLTNLLGSRQQFLDLARYLIEIAEHGPSRAEELRPEPSLFAQQPVPEYEKDIDHAGMIALLDAKSLQRGAALYDRTCANCHGTKDRPGSLPTALAFASGKFKNGSDPHGIYRTLTHGFGLMTPQPWMVPRQKYDVIHYIREAYLEPHNPSQYTAVSPEYLARLPRGTSRGPAPSSPEPWVTMNYGPSLMNTLEVGSDGNFAYKGIAVRLEDGPGGISQGRYWMLYDHDTLRLAAAWSGQGFLDWNGIHFNGQHEVHPRTVGTVHVANPVGPGWASPDGKGFDDVRWQGRDDRRYGPLPRSWAHYKGLYHYGNKTILSYTVGGVAVLEMPGLGGTSPAPVFTRTLNVGPRNKELLLQVAHLGAGSVLRVAKADQAGARVAVFGPEGKPAPLWPGGGAGGQVVAGLTPPVDGAAWQAGPEGQLRLQLPAGKEPLRLTLWFCRPEKAEHIPALIAAQARRGAGMDLTPLTRGGPPRWPESLATATNMDRDAGPFAALDLGLPDKNPWSCQLRLTGIDFFPPGDRAAVCSWDGDVWLVRGIDRPEKGLTWQRIASGLFQPLGLKVVAGKIFVGCRDQIVLLRDLNGDGETDLYENFNNDHQVTEHFHEFAMGLQVDAEGNFYYAKAARHAKTALVPHHGTLLKVSKDGSRTDILATGFRAPNGVCLNPDGTFLLTDQEGYWNPKNRINWVKPGGFYGNMWGYHDVKDTSDEAMEQPLCWITNHFDRSPAELLWVDSKNWGPLTGSLLNLSYGHGKIYVVPHEKVNGRVQGGMCALPIPSFPTGVMRGRFHPGNGDLYACGMFAWAGNQQQPGGLYRVRYTGKPVWLPVELHARPGGVEIRFSERLNPASAVKPEQYAVRTWSLKRSANYGSDHLHPKTLRVARARLGEDGRTVVLAVPDLQPTWCMEIRYSLQGPGGENVTGVIHNTIHELNQ